MRSSVDPQAQGALSFTCQYSECDAEYMLYLDLCYRLYSNVYPVALGQQKLKGVSNFFVGPEVVINLRVKKRNWRIKANSS